MLEVIISTVGQGSRMQIVNESIHKTMLPVNCKPVLSWIIDAIPMNYKIHILLGHLANQIIEYCEIVHANRDINFINVYPFQGKNSGNAFSLLTAKPFIIDSFWYLPCDGIFSEKIFFEKYEEDVYFVSEHIFDNPFQYTTFEIKKNNRICRVQHQGTLSESAFFFTGIMFIKNKHLFFQNLETRKVSSFTELIPEGKLTSKIEFWVDTGNIDSYKFAKRSLEKFDFSKKNEITYLLDNKVVKWIDDKEIMKRKPIKPKSNPEIYPPGQKLGEHFYSYERCPGQSFYEVYNKERFIELLKFLKTKLWIKSDVKIEKDCYDFYYSKTKKRVKQYLESSEIYENEIIFNGIKVPPIGKILEKIKWESIITNNSAFTIHGDLQFDNIIFDLNLNKFTLIDWRDSFSSQSIIGDIYYDLAKLKGGIEINYSEIKKGSFKYSRITDSIQVKWPTIKNREWYLNELDKFIESMDLDLEKVNTLVGIIYLNMAPLHTRDFSNFIWTMGKKQLSDILC
jgi:dTDP-glucose pyrophosphorylase